jgi:hypothetical protein
MATTALALGFLVMDSLMIGLRMASSLGLRSAIQFMGNMMPAVLSLAHRALILNGLGFSAGWVLSRLIP